MHNDDYKDFVRARFNGIADAAPEKVPALKLLREKLGLVVDNEIMFEKFRGTYTEKEIINPYER